MARTQEKTDLEALSALMQSADGRCAPACSFGYRIWHVQHAWVRHLEAALQEFDLTHLQFVVLAVAGWLWRETPSQTRIADHIGIDRMMASKILRLLEAKGYVVRTPHPGDPRANSVALTRAGVDALARALPVVRRAQQTFFGRLGPEGQQALGTQLDRLLELEGIGV